MGHSNNRKIDQARFVKSIVQGKTYTQSYIDAGGKPTGAASNGAKYAKTPVIKKAINEALQGQCLNSLVKLPLLTSLAMDKLAELIQDPDPKLSLQASKVALDKARDFLPKEVNVNHVHEVTEDDETKGTHAKLLAIAEKLQGKAANGNGFAGKIIEAARVGGSGSVQGDGGGVSGDGQESEYTVYTEQEAEAST